MYFDLEILILYALRAQYPRASERCICVDGSFPAPNHKPQLIIRKCPFQRTLTTPQEWSEILDCQFGMSLNNIVLWIKTSSTLPIVLALGSETKTIPPWVGFSTIQNKLKWIVWLYVYSKEKV